MKQPRVKLYISFFDLIINYFKILLGIDLYKGKKVKRFENLLEKHWSKEKCFTLSTCRVAFYYVLKSLNLQKDDEVLLTPIQIPDFVNVIISLGLKPVFVEVDKKTESIDILDLKKKINNKTKALLATYLTGMVPNISEIKKICDDNNIFLIEDISQSYGSSYSNKKAGSFGNATIGSLSLGKIISSIGGGFILMDDKQKIDYIERLLEKDLKLPSKSILIKICIFYLKISIVTSKYIFNFFTYYVFLIFSKISKKKFDELQRPTFKYTHKDKTIYDNPTIQRSLPLEMFSQFTDLQAKIAIKTFNNNVNFGLKKRQHLAKILYEKLSSKTKKFVPILVGKYDENAYWHFPIAVESSIKNEFQTYLMKKGYDVVGYGLRLCSHELAFENYKSNLINAKYVHDNTLFLPLFENLKENEIKKIADDINYFFDNK